MSKDIHDVLLDDQVEYVVDCKDHVLNVGDYVETPYHKNLMIVKKIEISHGCNKRRGDGTVYAEYVDNGSGEWWIARVLSYVSEEEIAKLLFES